MRNLLKFSINEQEKTKLFVLRHFSVASKTQKNTEETLQIVPGTRRSIFQAEEERNYWDPPILYKKPDDEAFKWMIGRYLEIKKLL